MTREEEIDKISSAFAIDEVKDTCNPASKRGLLYVGFVTGAEWADEHPHWISVNDELPKIGKDVLVLCEDGEMQVAHQYKEEIARWWSVDGFPLKNNITHWMHLPSPPKKGGKE